MVASEKIWALGTEKNPVKEREERKEETPAKEAALAKTGRTRGLLGNNAQTTLDGTLFEKECCWQMMRNKYTKTNWNLLCAAWNKSLGKDAPPLGSWAVEVVWRKRVSSSRILVWSEQCKQCFWKIHLEANRMAWRCKIQCRKTTWRLLESAGH